MNRATTVFLLLSSAGTLIATAQATTAQTPPGKACGLVTETEIQSVLGAKVTLKSGAIGDVQTCSGEASTATMTIRLFRRTGDPSGAKEKAGIEAIKKMGAQVDVKSSGGVTCMTTVPPANLAQYGFSTSCTVTNKAPMFAIIEIQAKTQKDMASMEKLRSVAEKMATRF